MDEKIRTRVIDTGGAAQSTLIEGEACRVCWITVSAETPGTSGKVVIYDGRGDDVPPAWQAETAYSHHFVFIPRILCDHGLYITADANVACYTVGYRPECWGERE